MKTEQLMKRITKLCKTYHFNLDRGLLYRTRMESYRSNSVEYRSLFNKVTDHEIRCMELDEQIYNLKCALDLITNKTQ